MFSSIKDLQSPAKPFSIRALLTPRQRTAGSSLFRTLQSSQLSGRTVDHLQRRRLPQDRND